MSWSAWLSPESSEIMCRTLSMSAREGRSCSSSLTRLWIGGILLWAGLVSNVDAAETKPGWQQQWEQIVREAKKEGQVTVYVHSTYAPALNSGAFEKAFPEIKLVVVSGVENDLERRFTAERRAGKYLADVFMVGVLRSDNFKQAKYLDPIKPVLLLPEVVMNPSGGRENIITAIPRNSICSDTWHLPN